MWHWPQYIKNWIFPHFLIRKSNFKCQIQIFLRISKVHFLPLCFHRRSTFVCLFANWRKYEEDFRFTKRKKKKKKNENSHQPLFFSEPLWRQACTGKWNYTTCTLFLLYIACVFIISFLLLLCLWYFRFYVLFGMILLVIF